MKVYSCLDGVEEVVLFTGVDSLYEHVSDRSTRMRSLMQDGTRELTRDDLRHSLDIDGIVYLYESDHDPDYSYKVVLHILDA